MKEARYYQKTEEGGLRCTLCPHHCRIGEGKRGLCGTRENRDGILVALNYEEVASLALDPIEKKPLRRFHPGSSILSTGTFGCNLFCPFCQNYGLSRASLEDIQTRRISAKDLVAIAVGERSMGNIGIAFTYNEPTVWYEYVLETSKLAKEEGLSVVLVTNGCIEEEPLLELLPYVDAMNIDLKTMNSETYKATLKGDLAAVQRTIERSVANRVHVEVTTLVVPGMNDSEEEIDALIQYLSGISPELPLHLSRYFPHYQMNDVPPTDPHIIYGAVKKAREKLKFVYTGNL